MKCVSCGIDNTLKDRTTNQGRCKQCNHRFVFEPSAMKTNLKFTDPFFAKVLNDISVNETLHFTPKQLSYLLEKRLHRKAFAASASGKMGCGLILLFLGLFLLATGVGIIFLAIGLVVIVIGLFQSRRKPRAPKKFLITPTMTEEWLRKWGEVNPLPEKLLPALPAIAPAPTTESLPDDVTDYSFDRLVVCDQDLIAQLLIANNFHFEYNCAILSISGYPQNIFDTTMQMLRRNPDLRVYALHDCSPLGVSLVHQLRTDPNWFPNDTAIVEVGLLPRQILATKTDMMIQTSSGFAKAAENLPIAVQQSLSEAELSWLKAGYFVELESFTPQRLIQILNRAITTNQEMMLEENISSPGDGYDSIYVVDSFG